MVDQISSVRAGRVHNSFSLETLLAKHEICSMATLYGGLDKPGPNLALMKWYPGYMSAPHTYATDRLSLVLSGMWWVNSGADFDPDSTVPVPAGGR